MTRDYFIRAASSEDIPFIVETIIEAEKSGTQTLSYSGLFGMEYGEVDNLLSQCLMEETEGCELSLSSYLIAEYEGKAVAAVGAWIEAENGISSSSIKGSLLAYILPHNAFLKFKEAGKIIHDLYIESDPGTLQIGVVYVNKSHRGQGLTIELIENQIKVLSERYPGLKESYVQVFSNNMGAIKAYSKLHFKIIKTVSTQNNEVLNYLPAASKVLMKLTLK